mmetsp:Transcript_7090/g.6348  ORF Transcript_7090/g.6348 Transcript_7090/m.6348 type:complete len:100 (-) Transcript_7090:1418-1717(-)
MKLSCLSFGKKRPKQPKVEIPRGPDYSMIQKIKESCHPVFLVQSNKDGQFYAMKVFPFKHDCVDPSYKLESRFFTFSHSSIIKMVDSKATEENLFEGKF